MYLQVIDIKTDWKLDLKHVQKLCRHCYKHVANNDSLNTEDMPKDLDASFYNCMFERNESSFNAETIGISPIKKSCWDKVSYGRNKDKGCSSMAQALDISAEELWSKTHAENIYII